MKEEGFDHLAVAMVILIHVAQLHLFDYYNGYAYSWGASVFDV